MLIDTWFNEYRFGIDMIHLAYEKTIDSTGKLAFPYINTILKAWYNKDIHTPNQVLEQDSDFEKSKNKQVLNALFELLPQKLIPFVLSVAGISQTKAVN